VGPLAAGAAFFLASAVSTRAAEPAETSSAGSAAAPGHGGAEALRAVAGFFASGTYVNADDGRGGEIEVSIVLDGSMRWEKRHPERSETRILAGPLAWSGGAHRQQAASLDLANAIRIQYHTFAAPFELAREDSSEFRADGASPEGWTRITRSWRETLQTTYEIDGDTGLVRRVTGRRGAGDEEHVIVTELGDFRDVETTSGTVRLPFRMTTRTEEGIVGEMRWKRLEVRESFPPQTFLPHDAAGDF
jgi:hypothetical protein